MTVEYVTVRHFFTVRNYLHWLSHNGPSELYALKLKRLQGEIQRSDAPLEQLRILMLHQTGTQMLGVCLIHKH